jgi:hypothetical protein
MMNCKNIKKIDFPNVRSIGSKCFSLCSKLKHINIPNAVRVEDYAFNFCSQLESIYLPKVTHLEDSVFKNCTKLSSVIAPNVTKISKYAFSNCKMLLCLRLSNEIKDDDIDITSTEGCNNLLVVYPMTNKMKNKIQLNIDSMIDLYFLLPLLCIENNDETDYNEIEDLVNIMCDEVIKFIIPLL